MSESEILDKGVQDIASTIFQQYHIDHNHERFQKQIKDLLDSRANALLLMSRLNNNTVKPKQ